MNNVNLSRDDYDRLMVKVRQVEALEKEEAVLVNPIPLFCRTVFNGHPVVRVIPKLNLPRMYSESDKAAEEAIDKLNEINDKLSEDIVILNVKLENAEHNKKAPNHTLWATTCCIGMSVCFCLGYIL